MPRPKGFITPESVKRKMRGPRPHSKGALRGELNPRWGKRHTEASKRKMGDASRRNWQVPAIRRRMIAAIRAGHARRKLAKLLDQPKQKAMPGQ